MASKGSAWEAANPTAAAIQRAKSQKLAAQLEAKRTASLSTGYGIGNLSIDDSPAKGATNVFGVDDGTNEKGWWAKTDAGTMNALDTDKKEKPSSQMSESLAPASGLQKKLDFSSMFANREPQSDTTTQATVEAAGSPLTSPAVSNSNGNGTQPVDLLTGDEEAAGWWKKMDPATLNTADVAVPMGQPSSFKPQFVGASGLTTSYLAKTCDDDNKPQGGIGAVWEQGSGEIL